MMLLHRGSSRVHCLQTPWRIVLYFYESQFVKLS